jgi:hypothetical protein
MRPEWAPGFREGVFWKTVHAYYNDPAAPSASPTRGPGAIRTWRRTPTLRSSPTPPFEHEDEHEHEDDF